MKKFVSSKSKSEQKEPLSGREEYKELMVDFCARTDFIYCFERKCLPAAHLSSNDALKKIDVVIDGFIYGPSVNYSPMRQHLKEILKELDLKEQLSENR